MVYMGTLGREIYLVVQGLVVNYITRIFSYFEINSHTQKLNKSQTKRANITGFTVFLCLSTVGVKYVLSFLLYSFYSLTMFD